MAIFVLLAVVAAIGAGAGLRYWWTSRERDELSHSPPPLFYELPPSLPESRGTVSQALFNATRPPVHPPQTNVNAPHLHTNGNGNGAARPADAPVVRHVAVEPPRITVQRPAARPLEAAHDSSETIRFIRPSDDISVQLLPGRLEVIEGATLHKEIRFVRVPGEPVHVILGREAGLTPHYVGLGSPTVSRRHARFDFTDNRWIVKNLSRTNPLVVNDDALFDTDVPRPLADGDRLELGEVVLLFHDH